MHLVVVMGAVGHLPAQITARPAEAVVERTIAAADLDMRAINGGALLPDGTFVTADPEALQVLFVNPEGKVTRAGGDGAEPGRFRQIRSVGVTGTRAWIVDGTLRRVTSFSGGGVLEAVKTAPLALTRDGRVQPLATPPMPVALLDGGVLLAQVRLGATDAVPPWATGRARGDVGVVTVGADGALGAVVAWVPVDPCSHPANVGTSGVVFPIPFCPRPLTVIAPDGARVAVIEAVRGKPGAVRIRIMGSDGDSLLVQTVTDRPVSVIPVAADSARAAILARMPAMTGLAEAYSAIPSAAYRPAARRALFARDGTLWLETAHDAPGTRWLAVDTTGAPTHLVVLPPDAALLAADGDALWAVVDGVGGGLALRRYRVRPRG